MIKKIIMTATKIKEKLETLTGEGRLDASAIKNLAEGYWGKISDLLRCAENEIQIGGATGSKLVNDSGIIVKKADDTEIFCILEDDDGSLRLGGATGYRLKVVAGSGWVAVRDDDDSHYRSLAVAYIHSHNGLLGKNLRPVESAADLRLQLRNNSYRIKCNDAASLEMASFAIDDFRQLKQGDCGIHRKIAVSAETSLSGASVTISNIAPQAAKIIGSGVIVSEAITSGDGATSFDIAYNAGAASQSIATGQAFAKNTKTQKFFDANANTNIASAQVDHVITPDLGTFSGGKIFTFCIYEELIAFDDIA